MKLTAHNSANSHMKDLLLLFSVPAGIIVVVIAFLYIPRLFAHPAYDFIYCEGYGCDSRYIVDTSGRVIASAEPERYSSRDSRLYYYDLERDSTRPLLPVDTANYQVDPSSRSPDGYLLQQATNSGGFLFWSDSRNNWFLKKGLSSKPVTLEGYDIKFIGWVLKNG